MWPAAHHCYCGERNKKRHSLLLLLPYVCHHHWVGGNRRKAEHCDRNRNRNRNVLFLGCSFSKVLARTSLHIWWPLPTTYHQPWICNIGIHQATRVNQRAFSCGKISPHSRSHWTTFFSPWKGKKKTSDVSEQTIKNGEMVQPSCHLAICTEPWFPPNCHWVSKQCDVGREGHEGVCPVWVIPGSSLEKKG